MQFGDGFYLSSVWSKNIQYATLLLKGKQRWRAGAEFARISLTGILCKCVLNNIQLLNPAGPAVATHCDSFRHTGPFTINTLSDYLVTCILPAHEAALTKYIMNISTSANLKT